jgi:hypothetical protein
MFDFKFSSFPVNQNTLDSTCFLAKKRLFVPRRRRSLVLSLFPKVDLHRRNGGQGIGKIRNSFEVALG